MDVLIALVVVALVSAGVFVGYSAWEDWKEAPKDAGAHNLPDGGVAALSPYTYMEPRITHGAY